MNIFIKSNIFKAFIVIVFLSFFTSLSADDSGDLEKVKQYIDNFGNQIVAIASDEDYSPEYKKEQLIALMNNAIDFNWVVRFVLSRHYQTASIEQKARFKRLYRQFMVNTYFSRLGVYADDSFEVINVIKQGRYYVIKCLFIHKDSSEVNIDFRVKDKNDSGFAILDIVAEGISLIETQRSEFGSVISNSGFDKFLDDLENKVEKLQFKSLKTLVQPHNHQKFSAIMKSAKKQSITILKQDKDIAVIISSDRYKELKKLEDILYGKAA